MKQALPCRDPQNDPEDWFISSNGKQYRDDEFPGVNLEAAEAEFAAREGTDRAAEDVAQVFRELEAAALKAALIRRRHARDKCYIECPVRSACLDAAMANEGTDALGEIHGTWGGYFEEQRRELYRAIERRRKPRQQE